MQLQKVQELERVANVVSREIERKLAMTAENRQEGKKHRVASIQRMSFPVPEQNGFHPRFILVVATRGKVEVFYILSHNI